MHFEHIHDDLDEGNFSVKSGELHFAKVPSLQLMDVLADYLGDTKLYFPLNQTLGSFDEVAQDCINWSPKIRSARFWTDQFSLLVPDSVHMFHDIEELVIEFDLFYGSGSDQKIVQLDEKDLSAFGNEISANFDRLKLLRISANSKRRGSLTKRAIRKRSEIYGEAYGELITQLDEFLNPRKKRCDFSLENL